MLAGSHGRIIPDVTGLGRRPLYSFSVVGDIVCLSAGGDYSRYSIVRQPVHHVLMLRFRLADTVRMW